MIYQPEADFDLLPQELRWRHVRFELTGEQVVDFTWEREWPDDAPSWRFQSAMP